MCVYNNGIYLKQDRALKFTLRNKIGFTLIELLVTILVLSVISVVALPSLSTLFRNNRLITNTDMFVNALNYARSTSLNDSMTVMVCPFSVANSTTCGGSWASGWIVVTQPIGGTATLLQSQQFSSSDPKLLSNVSSVAFDSHGLTTAPSHFTFCDSRGGDYAYSVEVLATGFVQSGTTPGKAVWDNSALTCP